MEKRTNRLLIILIILFTVLALWVIPEIIFDYESWPLNHAVKNTSPVLIYFMEGVTHIGDSLPVFGFCLLLVIIRRTRKTIAFPICATMILSPIVYLLLKIIFASDRSDIIKLIIETNNGFPAGHALNNAALYSMLIFLIFKYLKKSASKLILSFIFIFLIIAIGCSRVYLGIHSFGDVIGGWIIGFAIAVAVYFKWKTYFLNKLKRK